MPRASWRGFLRLSLVSCPIYLSPATITFELSTSSAFSSSAVKVDPVKAGGGSWYRDIGGSMGAALNTAQAMGAYTISDRGTWLSFGNKGDLTVLIEGDPRLLNRYDVILLNPAKHPVPKQALAQRFAQWLVSPEGQAAIGG